MDVRLDSPADEFDILNSGVLAAGEADAWTELFVRTRRNLAGDAELDAVAELLDLTAFADYMLLNSIRIGSRSTRGFGTTGSAVGRGSSSISWQKPGCVPRPPQPP